jgi:ferrochelatase
MQAPQDSLHPVPPTRIGVLLLNLGTPDAPTPAALRRYLRQFLSDRRVIEIPRLIWWPLLNGIILNTRPRKSARKYASIWTEKGSPLLVHTVEQTEALRIKLAESGYADVVVECAMRYGNPSVDSAMQSLKQQHVDRLLLLPLYPQYSAASTASALDAAFINLMQQRNVPAIRTVRHFHDDPAYIRALAQHIQAQWQQDGPPQVLLMSFHGMPAATLQRGDPYYCECLKTGRLLAEALQLPKERYRITFQSRFGRSKWLQPYTAATLKQLGQEKTTRLDVVCPGFVSDCLETLEEIAIEGKELFKMHGGGDYRYLSCLNNNTDWIGALASIVTTQIGAWPNKPQ